jgi:hypothetical protein
VVNQERYSWLGTGLRSGLPTSQGGFWPFEKPGLDAGSPGQGVTNLNIDSAIIEFTFALIFGFTGFAIAPRINEDETIPGS